jgi:polyisoprenoid-binding protein YceI
MPKFICGICVFLLTICQLQAQVYKTDNGKVAFVSKAPLNEFTGTSEKLEGLIDLDKNMLDFFVDLNTLNTGIGLRDKHMRDNYLETKKFPYGEFTGKMKTPIEMAVGKTYEVIAIGDFKIHGIAKPVEVPGKIKVISDTQVELTANFKVNLGDHKISVPKVVFYELSETQEVSIQAIFKKQ